MLLIYILVLSLWLALGFFGSITIPNSVQSIILLLIVLFAVLGFMARRLEHNLHHAIEKIK